MLAGYFVLVVLVVAFFTEVGLFREAEDGRHDILAALADDFLRRSKVTLNFSSWELLKLN